MKLRTKDVIIGMAFVLLWLAPLAYRGLTDRPMPGMPSLLRYVQNASCLFVDSVKAWRVDYLQARLAPGGEWITLPEEDYFKMEPFGHYRTRLHRLMDVSLTKSGYARRAELASWIRRRYSERHPDAPKLVAVRFIAAQYPLQRAAPSGAWQRPPLASFRSEALAILSTHEFLDESAPPTAPAQPPASP